MAQDSKDIRVIQAVNGIQKTSLGAFLTPKAESSNNGDSGGDIQKTVGIVSTKTTTDASIGAGTISPKMEKEDISAESKEIPEQVFEIKGEKVPLKDLLNSFETRQVISKRFDEVGKRELRVKEAQDKIRTERAELDYINEKFEEMREQVVAGNSLAALHIAMTMADTSGESKNPATLDLIKQAINISENFHAMSEEEQQIFLKNEEIAHKERKLTRQEKKQKAIEEHNQLQNFYNETLSKHSVTDTELDGAFEDIQTLPKFKEELDKLNPKERINYCTSWVLGKRFNAIIERGISSVDKSLLKDHNFRLALIEQVDPRCTEDDVAGIVKAYLAPNNGSAEVESEASTKDVIPEKITTPNRAPPEKAKAENNVPIRTWKDLVAKHSN